MTRIGLDFHGVIIRPSTRRPEDDRTLAAVVERQQAQEGMFAGVTTLVEATHGQVWVVSKAGSRMEQVARAWLEQVRFCEQTGLHSDHILFCRERQEKGLLCEGFGMTHFVDDRIHLMQILRHVVPNLFLIGVPEKKRFCPPWARYASTWSELVPEMLRQ